MPADLSVNKQGDVMMAYQGDTPWHQLGTVVNDPEITKSVEKFLTAANLDWEVQLKTMFYRHKQESIRVKQRRAVVRDSDGALLATVGSNFHPVQNKAAFEVLQPALDQFGVEIETAGALGKGDRVWMLAKLPEAIEPIPGDKLENYILLFNGHNGWTSYSARLTQVRVVCANTVALALRDAPMIKLRHIESQVEQLDQIADVIAKTLEVAHKTGESFKKLATRKMTLAEMRDYVNEVLGIDDEDDSLKIRRRDKIIELATSTGKGIEFAPETAWAAFNAVTEYIDHVRPAEGKMAKTIRQANASALFGSNAKIKVKALNIARKLAA